MTTKMRHWPSVGLVTAALAAIGGLVVGAAYWVGSEGVDRDTPDVGGPVRLVAFDSCDSALADLKRAALERVTPWGLEDGSFLAMERGVAVEDSASAPAAAGRDGGFSRTNAHEADADEPDLVKADGRRVVSVVDGALRVVDTASRALTATLSLPGGPGGALLLEGDRALVTGGPEVSVMTDSRIAGPVETRSRLTLVDLAGGARVLGSLTVDGSYLDARQVGSVARVVVRSTPRLEFTHSTGDADAEEALRRNREVITRSGIDDWLPRYTLDRGGDTTTGRLVDCAALSRPADHTGSAVLSVLTIDLRADLGDGDAIGVAADGDTVYGTGTSLYIADDRTPRLGAPFESRGAAPEPEQARTEVHAFDVAGPGRPVYLASGSVDGWLLNQYSLSEHRGHLRVATTMEEPGQGCCARPGPAPDSASAVTVLARRGATLERVGRVEGLGKGERIHSVRFLGDTAYVVTFRRTDPLYAVDLADPARPAVTGELKITGYSAYLHPVGEGRLLGVGQEATGEGRVTGTQVSLFDTSAAAPTRIGQHHVPGGHSEVEHDPHAFLHWPDRELVALPLTATGSRDGGGSEVLLLKVTRDGVAEVGRIAQPAGFDPIRRTLVAGGALWTVSASGAQANDLDGFGRLAWLPFR